MNQSEALAEVRSGKLRPVYVIYGGESFLEQELVREIKSAVVEPATADFNVHLLDPSSDQLPQALNLARTQPFFAKQRLVLVRDCSAFAAPSKATDEHAEAEEREERSGGDDLLLGYLKQPVASTCLLFLAGESIDNRRKVTKAAMSAGALVECKPLKDQDALFWMQTRAKVYGKRLSDQAARTLLERLGTNLRMIDTELAKLALYVGEAPDIKPDDVETTVGGMAETEVYRLTEAVMLKQGAQALILLEKVLRQVDHPLQLLASLTGRFRQMLLVKALVARGVSLQEGPQLAKMHPYAYKKVTQHIRSYPREEMVRAMEKLLEADVAMKSGYDPRLTVETLVVELLG